MAHDGTMTAPATRTDTPLTRAKAAIRDLPAWLAGLSGPALGGAMIELREMIVCEEAAFAIALRRFDKSGEYKADGAVSLVEWLRSMCRLSGGAATERVGIARQLEQLPQTEQAFARGELGYQHVAVMARTAEHVGSAAVRLDEAALLKAAATMDPGQFTNLAKHFEHRVDAAGALAETNRAYTRRYFQVSEPLDGLVRLDGLLDAEGGAVVRTALNALMRPDQTDERTSGQRRADALLELCHRPSPPAGHPGQPGHPGRDRRIPGWRAREWHPGPRRDGPPAGLRCRAHPDHRHGRDRSRDQPGQSDDSPRHPAGAGRPRPSLCRRWL